MAVEVTAAVVATRLTLVAAVELPAVASGAVETAAASEGGEAPRPSRSAISVPRHSSRRRRS